MTRCSHCGGEPRGGVCSNCGSPIADAAGPVEVPDLPLDATPEDVAEGLRALIRLTGAGAEAADLPATATRALLGMTSGYDDDPVEILADYVAEVAAASVVAPRIPYASLCCLHCMPFGGEVAVEVACGARSVTIEGLARAVDALARRFQRPDALAAAVAEAIDQALEPAAVRVTLEVSRPCSGCSGPHEPPLRATFKAERGET